MRLSRSDHLLLARIPVLLRPFHAKARRHWIAVGCGLFVMIGGAGIAHQAHAFGDGILMLVVDASGYFLHAVGAVPILRHVEAAVDSLLA